MLELETSLMHSNFLNFAVGTHAWCFLVALSRPESNH